MADGSSSSASAIGTRVLAIAAPPRDAGSARLRPQRKKIAERPTEQRAAFGAELRESIEPRRTRTRRPEWTRPDESPPLPGAPRFDVENLIADADARTRPLPDLTGSS